MGVAAALGSVALLGCGGAEKASISRGDGSTTSVPTTTPAPQSTTTSGAQGSTTRPTSAPASTTPTTRGATGTTAAASRDFTVEYPTGWGPGGQLQATAFANGATCGSAVIVDRAPPDGSGPGARVEQSYVQVCWRPLDGQTLSAFMAATYGSVGGFQTTTLAGRPAYVSRAGTSSTSFVDTSTRRYQVVTSVTATAALEATRLAEVDRILRSLTLPS
ncbi:MAG TPA: hypothetical protein VFK43_09140 [Acidimicrobiales bacterium]|nr:hypothetical protein [Acidimicrobiales bacterium]